jgi:hypothetical protein
MDRSSPANCCGKPVSLKALRVHEPSQEASKLTIVDKQILHDYSFKQ